MKRFLNNSKWNSCIYAGISSLIAMAVLWLLWNVFSDHDLSPEIWISLTVAVVLIQAGVAYVFGLRSQRRLDMLQLALKQGLAGNWSTRLPKLEGDVYADVFRDFNLLFSRLEDRMKLLQQLSERDAAAGESDKESAVLEERRRLARDLHDTVSQQLFALHMSASSLPKLLEKDPAQAQKLMQQLIAMSSSAQRQMRGLIAQLRPMELQGRSLAEALERWFPDYCRHNGLQGTLDIQLSGPLSEGKEQQLFLIIQEAMANVVKHAEARSVRLFLGETEHQISLQVEDDGVGFQPGKVREGGYGLSTMRERALKLGGDAEIVTKVGTGTRVRVWIPKFGEELPAVNGQEEDKQ